MKTLYLHVGTHKTGTTSFQQFLFDKRAYLTENGICPHIEDRPPSMQAGNSYEFAHYFVRSSLQTVMRASGIVRVHSASEFVSYVRALRRQFADCACPSYLISAETLCFLRTPLERMKLRLLAYALNARIVPIVVFRNERDWRASWEHQLQTNPFVRSIMNNPKFTIIDDWYFNKVDVLRFWSGVGKVKTVDYDEAMQSDGDIITALLRTLGVPCPPDTGYRLNQRASSS